jgi:hypothetical protein
MRAPARLSVSLALLLTAVAPVAADDPYGFRYAFGPSC